MTFPHLRGWRVFGLYGLIISALGSYAWHLHGEKMRRQAHYEGISKSFSQACNPIGRAQNTNIYSIDRYARDWPCAYNDSLSRQADFFQKTLDDFSKFVDAERQRAKREDTTAAHLKGLFADPALQDSLAQKRAVLADSLRFSARKKPALLAAVEANFSEENRAAVTRILANGRDDQKALLLECLRLRDAATVGQVLRYLDSQKKDGTIPMEGVMPGISCRKTCIRAGELLWGDLFATKYCSTLSDNLTMFVNGKSIPVENGVGKFRQVYQTPGEKNLLAEIRLKNPVTGAIDTLKKEFSIQICD